MRLTISTNAHALATRFGRWPSRAMEAVDAEFSRGAQLIARDMKRGAPKAFSILTNAIRVLRNGMADYSAVAGTDYSVMPETGTGPGGNPPVQALKDWIRVKRITPRDPHMDVDDLAFVIGRSIRRKGTPKQPYAQPALDKHIAAIIARSGKAMVTAF